MAKTGWRFAEPESWFLSDYAASGCRRALARWWVSLRTNPPSRRVEADIGLAVEFQTQSHLTTVFRGTRKRYSARLFSTNCVDGDLVQGSDGHMIAKAATLKENGVANAETPTDNAS
jgi:hypothetical protein